MIFPKGGLGCCLSEKSSTRVLALVLRVGDPCLASGGPVRGTETTELGRKQTLWLCWVLYECFQPRLLDNYFSPLESLFLSFFFYDSRCCSCVIFHLLIKSLRTFDAKNCFLLHFSWNKSGSQEQPLCSSSKTRRLKTTLRCKKLPLPLRSALQDGSGRKSAAVGLPGADQELDFASSSPLHSKCG